MSLPSSVHSAPSQKKPFRSVLEALTNFADLLPNQKVWSFLNDSGDVISDSYTYKELQNATDAAADELVRVHKLKEGDRAMLVFFPGLAFTASLLACFKIGVIAVPVFPPDPRRLQKDLDHFVSIQKSSGAQFALTHSAYNYAKKVTDIGRMFRSRSEQTWPDLKWIVIDDALNKGKKSPPANAQTFRSKVILDSQIAFLQYTSGSTSEPKGVMISHSNLSHNLTLITRELQVDTNTVNISWLPQYHDMGLIGSYLGTLYCGGTGYFLSPISFLKDPNVWLKCISKYRGSHTQAPNFAYPLAVRKYREMIDHGDNVPAWDLSCVKHMINAAEPVDVKAIQLFYETFFPLGLPVNVVIPTYGLAEHTVFVCSDGKNILHLNKASLENGRAVVVKQEPLSHSTSLRVNTIGKVGGDGDDSKTVESGDLESISQQMIVGCGFYEKGESVLVRIIDPTTCVPVEDGSVGEIWVDSPSKAQGYWGQPELTTDSFLAKVAGEDTNARSYLRTGDMGFLYNKELFICGRMKDLIIIRGANHYPQDIERTAEQGCESLRAGCSAAFAVSHDHTEAVVYVAELKADVDKSKYESIVSTIKTLISKEHGLSLTSICLLHTKSVIKTTSGKISRAGCKKAFLANTLSLLYKWEGVPESEPVDINESVETVHVNGSSVATGKDTSTNTTAANKNGGKKLPSYSQTEIWAMDIPALVTLLESTIINISSQSPSPLSAPLPADRSIVSLGLDSFTIVQFKGVLEKKFYCDIPDEFLFTNLATLTELALAIRNGTGTLTPEQKAQVESGPSDGTETAGQTGSSTLEVEAQGKGTKKGKGGKGKGGNQGKSTVIEQGNPLCPWFVCCY